MKPLYDARVGDLGPGDFVKVECRCGHVQLLPDSCFASGKLQAYTLIKDLDARLRCRGWIVPRRVV